MEQLSSKKKILLFKRISLPLKLNVKILIGENLLSKTIQVTVLTKNWGSDINGDVSIVQ